MNQPEVGLRLQSVAVDFVLRSSLRLVFTPRNRPTDHLITTAAVGMQDVRRRESKDHGEIVGRESCQRRLGPGDRIPTHPKGMLRILTGIEDRYRFSIHSSNLQLLPAMLLANVANRSIDRVCTRRVHREHRDAS